METKSINIFKGVFIVVITLFLALILFSFIIGWNLITLFLFWFIVVPVVSIYLPAKILKNEDWLLQAISGLVLFYGVMAFMIFRHYQTDYFKIMIISGGVNLLVVAGFLLAEKLNHQNPD